MYCLIHRRIKYRNKQDKRQGTTGWLTLFTLYRLSFVCNEKCRDNEMILCAYFIALFFAHIYLYTRLLLLFFACFVLKCKLITNKYFFILTNATKFKFSLLALIVWFRHKWNKFVLKFVQLRMETQSAWQLSNQWQYNFKRLI